MAATRKLVLKTNFKDVDLVVLYIYIDMNLIVVFERPCMEYPHEVTILKWNPSEGTAGNCATL